VAKTTIGAWTIPILFPPHFKNAVSSPKKGCTVGKWCFLCTPFHGQGNDAHSHANWTIFDEVMAKTMIGSWTIPLLFHQHVKNAVSPPKNGCTVVKWCFLCSSFYGQGNDAHSHANWTIFDEVLAKTMVASMTIHTYCFLHRLEILYLHQKLNVKLSSDVFYVLLLMRKAMMPSPI
jgi:hypothetical protein